MTDSLINIYERRTCMLLDGHEQQHMFLPHLFKFYSLNMFTDVKRYRMMFLYMYKLYNYFFSILLSFLRGERR